MNQKRSQSTGRPPARAGQQALRIIGGVFRSRKIRFPAISGLRPTGDRVRETLFNWLGQSLHGKHCLDLFAGSGALGIEALSRGAVQVDAVDSQLEAVRQLRRNTEELDLSQVAPAQYRVHHGEALGFLERTVGRYDVVFLDPPFATDLWQRLLEKLPRVLRPGAVVYAEAASPPDALHPLPAGWLMIRSAKAGAVWFALLQYEYSQEAPAQTEVN